MRKHLILILLLISTLSYGQVVTLNGSGTDPEGDAIIYTWRQLTGPVLVTFTPSKNVAKPSVTAAWVPGVYTFELTVTDASFIVGPYGRDTMTITVTRPNASPKANAGPDQTLTLPAPVATIGLPDGPGLTVQWVKMSGPAQGAIKFPTQSITDVTGLVRGEYVFRKIVRDSGGLTGSDDVTIRVINKCTWWMRLFRVC